MNLLGAKKTLWVLSVAGGLLLQLLLLQFLFICCKSWEEKEETKPQLVTLDLTEMSRPKQAPAPENTQIPIQAPAQIELPEPSEPPEPLPEQKAEPQTVQEILPEPEPVPEPEPEKVPQVKPIIKPRPPEKKKNKPEPVKKVPIRKESAVAPAQINVATPTPPPASKENMIKPVPVAAVPAPGERQEAPAQKVGTVKNDFSAWLKKVYKTIERNKVYPEKARRYGIKGQIPVRFSIAADGRAQNIEIVGKADRELQRAAEKLLRQVRFEAPPSGWNPSSRIEFTINYYLR